MKKIKPKIRACLYLSFCAIVLILFFYILNKEKRVLSFDINTYIDTFFSEPSTEAEVEDDSGMGYQITGKQYTFPQENFLDEYSIVDYPVIQFMDGEANLNLEQRINQQLFDTAMLHYQEELEHEIKAVYACNYYIMSADTDYICIYYDESISSGAGRPVNFDDVITISLETGEKLSLDDFGNKDDILKKVRNYSGVIYANRPFDEERWNENIDEFIEEWKEDKDAPYYGYYLHRGRLGLFFNYYETGRVKMAFEFEDVVDPMPESFR